jgi:hypothetical protein
VSANGNEWRQTPDYRVIILKRMEGWTCKVIRRADNCEYDCSTKFPSPNEAKLAAFDFLWPAESRVM